MSRVGTRPSLLGVFALFLLTILLGSTASSPGDFSSSDTVYRSKLLTGNTHTKQAVTSSGNASKSAVLGSTTTNTKPTDAGQIPSALPSIHVGLTNSSSPILRKIAEYEKAAGYAVASRVMVFTDTPTSVAEAQVSAADMSGILNEFSRFGIKPLVILEPTTSTGNVNFHDYSNGAYDITLDNYFHTLKDHKVNNLAMGMWVYFPEANLPEWGATDPTDFAGNVTRSVKIQKKYFPSSQSSIMLDGESYPSSITDWGAGSYVSLLPYVQNIPKGMLDSFGYQGFPWAPAKGIDQETSYDPSQYLKPSLAIEAARQLGVSSIWLNSGTFGSMYTHDSSQTVQLSPGQRQTILGSVDTQAKSIQNAGFKVAINLFSQDKSSDSEGIDWSYWKTGAMSQSPATPVFISFASQLRRDQVDLWLFDSF